jgi:hypothetical protein
MAASLREAAKDFLAGFGGDVPHWLRPQAEVLQQALDAEPVAVAPLAGGEAVPLRFSVLVCSDMMEAYRALARAVHVKVEDGNKLGVHDELNETLDRVLELDQLALVQPLPASDGMKAFTERQGREVKIRNRWWVSRGVHEGGLGVILSADDDQIEVREMDANERVSEYARAHLGSADVDRPAYLFHASFMLGGEPQSVSCSIAADTMDQAVTQGRQMLALLFGIDVDKAQTRTVAPRAQA